MKAQKMRDIAVMIDQELGGNTGFLLITFPFYDGRQKTCQSDYISNGRREDMLRFLKETYLRLSAGQDFPTPEEN